MEKRQLHLNQVEISDGKCVLYVMSRDIRLQDNHALLLAQKSALESKLPLVIMFNLLPKAGVRRREHFAFLLTGLQQLAVEAEKLGIGFVLTQGDAKDEILRLIDALHPKEVLFDFSPLRYARALQKAVASEAPCHCSVVDTHNIVPLWVLSDKEEFAAHTMRRKVHLQLAQWLVEPDELVEHPHPLESELSKPNWDVAFASLVSIPSATSLYDFIPGELAAHQQLQHFIADKLETYAEARNNPTLDGQSELSPYLHFGNISALRVALTVQREALEPPLLLRAAKLASVSDPATRMDSCNALLEELIVRKELADNYCFYNPHYDSLEGAKDWAKKSLAEHADDPRDFIYSREQWERADTHDAAWNAAQLQMMHSGKMHGYMRMYWAKKILEWSASPAEAIATAIYLNDSYSLDGGDPNGYVSIMWSIAGIHDRPWFDRGVYGQIRYMNEGGLRRKFDLDRYITTWTVAK